MTDVLFQDKDFSIYKNQTSVYFNHNNDDTFICNDNEMKSKEYQFESLPEAYIWIIKVNNCFIYIPYINDVVWKPYYKLDRAEEDIKMNFKELKTEAKLDWEGKASIKMSIADFTFAGSVSPEKWKVGLSYSLGPKQPEVSKLDEKFRKGEAGFQGIVELIKDGEKFKEFGNLKELIEGLGDLFSSEIDAIKEALETFEKIEKVKPGNIGVEIGVGVSGPGPEAERGPSPPPENIFFSVKFTF